LEAGAAAARERKPAAVGLVWTVHESPVDPETLEVGEYIAVDIRMTGAAAVDPRGDAGAPGSWMMTERITTDPQDLGVVRDAEGARVGRVMELEGSMISIEWEEEFEPVPALDELSPAD
jgi:hypothetical protein